MINFFIVAGFAAYSNDIDYLVQLSSFFAFRVSMLSGGERRRLQLLEVLTKVGMIVLEFNFIGFQ